MKTLPVRAVVAIVFFGAIAACSISAQTLFFQSIYGFDGANGAAPSTLVQGYDGNFYGTTEGGGSNNNGTVFRLTPSGMLTTLYNFCSQPNCTDGSAPRGGLVQGYDGNLYGTTWLGGTSTGCADGCGTVFAISPSGSFGTIYSFCSQHDCYDGAAPMARLTLGSDDNLYGTTFYGGSTNCFGGGCGTIFQISSGRLSTLYRFTSSANPDSPLVQGADGNLYGAAGGGIGFGIVFGITTNGYLGVLYEFCHLGGCSDGNSPIGALVQGTDGNLYGVTAYGGNLNSSCGMPGWGCGIVYRLTLAGALTTLYEFCALPNCGDGNSPLAGLVQGSDGNFYGTTTGGGASGGGTIFQITPAGVFTTLHNFSGPDGWEPAAELIQARNQAFYGTTAGGGANRYGSVYRLGPVPPCSNCGR